MNEPTIPHAMKTDLTIPNSESRIISMVPCDYSITFSCGEGKVIISLADGSVTLENCELPEAAQEFWKAVTNAFPSVAEGIRVHAK